MITVQLTYNDGSVIPPISVACIAPIGKGGSIEGGYMKTYSFKVDNVRKFHIGPSPIIPSHDSNQIMSLIEWGNLLKESEIFGECFRTSLTSAPTPYITFGNGYSYALMVALLSLYRLHWENSDYSKDVTEMVKRGMDVDSAVVMASIFNANKEVVGGYRWNNHTIYRSLFPVEGLLRATKEALSASIDQPPAVDVKEPCRVTFNDLIERSQSKMDINRTNFTEYQKVVMMSKDSSTSEKIFDDIKEIINA